MRILFIIITTFLLCANASAQIKVYEKFDDFNNDILSIKDNDTTYVVNFWATWCIPCVKELPFFEELNTKYKNEKVKIVLVSMDFTIEQVTNFVNKKNLHNKVVLLTDSKTNSWIDKVDPSWSGAIPITLFIKGEEKHFYEKDYHNLKEIETDLLKLK